MTPMNWEPMTEDAVFEEGEECLVALHPYLGYTRREKMVYASYSFWLNDDEYDREAFTHFARITNPNEEGV